LELHRFGVIPLSLLDLGAGPAQILDKRGIPVAGLDHAGAITWLAHRSPRPYERLHRPPAVLA